MTVARTLGLSACMSKEVVCTFALALVLTLALAASSCGLAFDDGDAYLLDGDARIGEACSGSDQDSSTLRLSSNLRTPGSWYQVVDIEAAGERFPFPESGFPVYRVEVTSEPIGPSREIPELLAEPGLLEIVSVHLERSESTDVFLRLDEGGFADFGFASLNDGSIEPFVPCEVFERQQAVLSQYLQSLPHLDTPELRANEVLRLSNAAGDSPAAIEDFRTFVAGEGLVD